MYYKFFKSFYEAAAKKMSEDCREFIEEGTKILDLGCGSGIVGKAFQSFFKADLLGVDIKDRRIYDIPFRAIDGKTLPFDNKSFDIVLISYVLHHSEDPLGLLREAKRVSKKRIIIFEDLPDGLVSGFFCRLHGISFDKLFGNPSKTSFHSEEGWKKIFREAGLELLSKKRVSNFPVKKEIFVLGERATSSAAERFSDKEEVEGPTPSSPTSNNNK